MTYLFLLLRLFLMTFKTIWEATGPSFQYLVPNLRTETMIMNQNKQPRDLKRNRDDTQPYNNPTRQTIEERISLGSRKLFHV